MKAAEDALFNYRKVPKFIDEIRTWGVAPFASFPYFAVPATAKALAHRPAAVNRYGNIFRSFEDRETSAREREVLPRYMTDGWARLPTEDPQGRAQYVNVRYLLPFGDLSDVAHLGEEGGRNAQPFVSQRMPAVQLAAAFATVA